MKGIYTVKRHDGSAVYINYTPPSGRRVRELVEQVPGGKDFTPRLRAAEKRAAERLMQRRGAIVEGRHEDLLGRQRAIVPAFSEYVERFYLPALERSRMKERPRKREVYRVTGGTLGRYFADVSLDQITRTRVEGFIEARRKEGAGAAGVNRDLARLSHVWNDAAGRSEFERLLPGRNPCWKLKLAEEPVSWRPMRDDEEPRLLAALDDRDVRALVEFLLHGGMRPEAALQLCWRDVNLERMWVDVPTAINKTRGYRVYLNSRLQEVLRAHFASRPLLRREPDAFVFGHRNGKPRRSVRGAWQVACEKAGIQGLALRGLRATAATRLQEAGANEFDVKLHLGHAVGSMGVTGRYIDPHEEARRRVAELTIRYRPDGTNVVPIRADLVTRLSREPFQSRTMLG